MSRPGDIALGAAAFTVAAALLVWSYRAPLPPKPSPPALQLAPEAPTACRGPQVALDLAGADLTRAGGPELVNTEQSVHAPVQLTPGTWRVEAWAATTWFDGQPGRLGVSMDGEHFTTLSIPEGPSRRVSQTFDLSEPKVGQVFFRFENDAYAPADKRDRNLHLSRLRLERVAAPSADDRLAALKREMKGSNLLLISIDTLRADHLGSYGYARDTSPMLDAMARQGVRFVNAVASSHWTAPSHATMFTGLHNEEHGLTSVNHRLGDEARTLAEVLRDGGYRTSAHTGSMFVSARFGLHQGFDVWREEPGQTIKQIDATAEQVNGSEPFFALFHTYQPHEPYDPPPPYDARWVPEAPPGRDLRRTLLDLGPVTPHELEHLVALYDGEVRFTDSLVGRLLEDMRQSGVLDRTLVVVTSDHGEEFHDHGRVGHGQLYGEVVRVPLLMRHPALARWADHEVAEVFGGVDLMPTLLDLLGVEGPPMSGRSRAEALVGRCDPEAVAVSTSDRARPGDYSEIGLGHHYLRAEYEQLFRVDADRDEQSDVAGEVDLAPYRGRARAWREAHPRGVPTAATEPYDAELLRAMGYLAR